MTSRRTVSQCSPSTSASIRISRGDITRRWMRIASRAWPANEENSEAPVLVAKLLVDISAATCRYVLLLLLFAAEVAARAIRGCTHIHGKNRKNCQEMGKVRANILRKQRSGRKSASLFRILHGDVHLFRGQLLSWTNVTEPK